MKNSFDLRSKVFACERPAAIDRVSDLIQFAVRDAFRKQLAIRTLTRERRRTQGGVFSVR
jgi:hypothetical protein